MHRLWNMLLTDNGLPVDRCWPAGWTPTIVWCVDTRVCLADTNTTFCIG